MKLILGFFTGAVLPLQKCTGANPKFYTVFVLILLNQYYYFKYKFNCSKFIVYYLLPVGVLQYRSKKKIFWPLCAFGKQIITQIPDVWFDIDVLHLQIRTFVK
jgi:hypothetical protein